MTARHRTQPQSNKRRISFPPLPDLACELDHRVRQIPRGSLTTFGDLARSLGDRRAAVWVANRLASCAVDADLPWHRVVRSTGELAGSTDRQREQNRRLRTERHKLERCRDETVRVSLERRFSEFVGQPPLAGLSRWLTRAATRVHETPTQLQPSIVAGLDMAYPSPEVATVAAVALEFPSGAVLASMQTQAPVRFPYIPGYLTFRELPAMVLGLKLLAEAGWRPDVVFVDGQGRMHPHRGGIATGFAAVTGISTIGVGKSLLHGKIVLASKGDAPNAVLDGEELLGYALHSPTSRKPIYVSVGGWISLEQALDWTRLMMAGRRLPRPIAEADRLSRKRPRNDA